MKGIKGAICVLLVLMAIVLASGCSEEEERGFDEAEMYDDSQAGTGEQYRKDMEAQNYEDDRYAGTDEDRAGSRESEASYDLTGYYEHQYVAYEESFDGVPDLAYLPDTYCTVPVMPGDVVEITASATSVDGDVYFLLGGEALEEHYVLGNTFSNVPSMQSDYTQEVIAQMGQEYYQVFAVRDPACYKFTFAVQDQDLGNEVSGKMKITVYSSHTEDEHWDYFKKINENRIDALEAGNRYLDAQLAKWEKEEDDRNWWIEQQFSYGDSVE